MHRRSYRAGFFAMVLAVAGGCAPSTDGAAEQGDALVSEASVDEARRSGDPARMASALRSLASSRAPWHRSRRLEGTKRLLAGLRTDEVDAVRAAYIARYGEDPEITIRSDGLFDFLVRLDRTEELELLSVVQAARMTEDVSRLAALFARASDGALTGDDRKDYYATLPRMGLWSAPVRARPGDRSLDALERVHLRSRWAERSDVDLDDALRTIEGALPAPALGAPQPRERSVAVVVSSHGAQWQELMGWAEPMLEKGYHLQVFTPDGRPAAFQRDSLSVSEKTAPLGFGCPGELDPAGETGAHAARILAEAVSAERFDPELYGAVYLAGGLGFNEDVAYAEPRGGASGEAVLTAGTHVRTMMAAALASKLPVVAICHGPTLFAAVRMPGTNELLASGIETASLPPFESYVGFTERKEIQFTYDVNTHRVLEAAGASTSVVRDVAAMSRVVRARKHDIDLVTGPGPQAAANLVAPTIEALARRWPR